MTKRPAARGDRSTVPGLALHATAEKVEALLKERARRLRDVNKKKEQVTQAHAAADREAQATWLKMQPLVARHDVLVQELSALFDELLTKGRLAAKARAQVLEVRSALELQGMLPPLGGRDEAKDDGSFPWDDDEPNAAGASGPSHEARPNAGPHAEAASDSKASGKRNRASAAAGNAARDVASAHQPGPERRSLRELFRSLASAVHPDRARQEPERERRTEVMKEVTRAYEAGDLARLIELESAWQSERVLAGDGDPEQRCRELERVNRELLDQVRTLTRDLRDVKRRARSASFGPLESLLEQAQHELDELASVRDFVRKFRDGKVSLSEFISGPPKSYDVDEFLDFALDGLLMDELSTEPARGPRRRRRNSKAK
jgi:hypothetical protein